jgi:hypothetical protein
MKYILKFLLLCFFGNHLYGQGTYTQQQRIRDSLRLDSTAGFWDLTGPNRVLASLTPARLAPQTQICFDKKFAYYARNNGKISNGCFYVNTTSGYIAMFYSNLQLSCDGINNFQPGYEMAIMSKTGESIRYSVDKRNRRTYFSDGIAVEMDRTTPTTFVYRNSRYVGPPTVPFTDQQLMTLPYVIESATASSTRYLFGAKLPRTIPLKNYLGAFGVGYFEDNANNTYLCLASESPNLFVKVTSIEDVAECFDGTQFTEDRREQGTQQEDQRINKKELSLEKRATDLANNRSNCAAIENRIIAHKKQILDKEKAANELVKSGANLMDVKNTNAQRIMAAAGDVRNQVISERLKVEKRICSVEYSMQLYTKEYPGRSQTGLINQKQCLLNAVQQLQTLEAEMVAIDARNSNNFSKAMVEKNTLYFQRKATINTNCNVDKQGTIKP